MRKLSVLIAGVFVATSCSTAPVDLDVATLEPTSDFSDFSGSLQPPEDLSMVIPDDPSEGATGATVAPGATNDAAVSNGVPQQAGADDAFVITFSSDAIEAVAQRAGIKKPKPNADPTPTADDDEAIVIVGLPVVPGTSPGATPTPTPLPRNRPKNPNSPKAEPTTTPTTPAATATPQPPAATPTPQPPSATATPLPTATAGPTATPRPTSPPAPTSTAPTTSVSPIASNFNINAWMADAAALGEHTSGNFRTVCDVSHYANNDPLVFPGETGASHLHMFFGNTGADADSTYSSLRTTGGGTCLGGPVNRSGYWVPALLDGDGDIVEPEVITVYYKTKDSVNGNVTDFPPGFGMIGGAPQLNGFGNSSHQWTCRENGQNSATIVDCAPGNDVKLIIFFPNCWDGERLWSSDRSHIVYPVSGESTCPASHPVLMPTVSYQFFWASDGTADQWYLSSDTDSMVAAGEGGASAHADWFGAWDPDIQSIFFNECIVDEKDCNFGSIGDGRRLTGTGGG